MQHSDLLPTQQSKLNAYAELLRKWNQRINLVSPSTISQLEGRHIADSLQVVSYLNVGPILDMGCGAGLPSIPCAIARPNLQFIALDSDQRKTAFVRQAVLELGLVNVEVVTSRIDQHVPNTPYKVVTARALASLDNLLEFTYPILAHDGRAIFMKGKMAGDEIEAAKHHWHFHHKQHTSFTDVEASVIEITNIVPRET